MQLNISNIFCSSINARGVKPNVDLHYQIKLLSITEDKLKRKSELK